MGLARPGGHLVVGVSLQEVLSHVRRQDVEQQTLVVLTLLLHVLHLLPGLQAPQEVQPRHGLQLPTKKSRNEMLKTEAQVSSLSCWPHLSAVVEDCDHKHRHENQTNSPLAELLGADLRSTGGQGETGDGMRRPSTQRRPTAPERTSESR